jgi:hypothetical protein
MWNLLQALIVFAVFASNVQYGWTDNGYVVSVVGLLAAAVATAVLSDAIDLVRRFRKPVGAEHVVCPPSRDPPRRRRYGRSMALGRTQQHDHRPRRRRAGLDRNRGVVLADRVPGGAEMSIRNLIALTLIHPIRPRPHAIEAATGVAHHPPRCGDLRRPRCNRLRLSPGRDMDRRHDRRLALHRGADVPDERSGAVCAGGVGVLYCVAAEQLG